WCAYPASFVPPIPAGTSLIWARFLVLRHTPLSARKVLRQFVVLFILQDIIIILLPILTPLVTGLEKYEQTLLFLLMHMDLMLGQLELL
ncbi:MAG: hypothetical protein FWD78_16030, partial [Treponema sp.]|nr:hypothetical protein [Treponema sp.]